MYNTDYVGGCVWVNGHYVVIDNAVLFASQWWEIQSGNA